MDDPLLALLPKAKRRWAKSDPVLHAIARSTPPPVRTLQFDEPFHALVGSIAHQQVSLAAGRAIFARVDAAAGGRALDEPGSSGPRRASGTSRASPEGILKAGPDALRAAGLSRPKVAYVMDLAQKHITGEVDLGGLQAMDDETAIATLTKVKGIGVWTAKMFLLFHLHRPDVHVPEDLGVQIAVSMAYKVPRARVQAKLAKLQPLWAPYNSLAALTLWNWRRTPDE